MADLYGDDRAEGLNDEEEDPEEESSSELVADGARPASGSPSRALVPVVKPGVGLGGRDSPRSSSVGTGAAEVEELLKQLKALYRPQDEDMSEYLTRITRLVLALKTLGHEVSITDLARVSLKAELVQEAYERVGDRWDVRGMVRYLREKFTTAAVGTEMPAENITEHVSAIGELIMQLGGKESTQSGKLFSTPSQDEDRPAGGTPPRPISLGDMSRERMGPKDLGGDSPLRAKVAALEMELEALRHGSEASDGHKDLAAALEAQTRALEAALTGKSQQTSLTSVKTDVNWPTLTDDRSEARDVVQFYEEFEDCCSLANNCKGMSYREQLIALRGRCKGSRLKTYTNIYRSAWKSGEILENPEKVYNRIKEKHLVFAESKEEKEVRIDNEHALLNKGRMSAHQFEPLFEASVSELESIGLGKTPRELYLSYLRKMPMHLQKEIRGDKRLWKGEALLRSPQTCIGLFWSLNNEKQLTEQLPTPSTRMEMKWAVDSRRKMQKRQSKKQARLLRPRLQLRRLPLLVLLQVHRASWRPSKKRSASTSETTGTVRKAVPAHGHMTRS